MKKVVWHRFLSAPLCSPMIVSRIEKGASIVSVVKIYLQDLYALQLEDDILCAKDDDVGAASSNPSTINHHVLDEKNELYNIIQE